MKSPVSDLSQGFSLTVGESVHSVGYRASRSSLEVGCRATIWQDLAAPADLHSPLCTCFLQLPLKSPYAFIMCLAIVPRRLSAIRVNSLLSLENVSTELGVQRVYKNKYLQDGWQDLPSLTSQPSLLPV